MVFTPAGSSQQSLGVEAEAASPCPVGRLAELVAGKWTLLIIRDLASGRQHFGELERSLLGISPRTLCDRLRMLTEHGLVTRTRVKGLPPRTIYELTARGRALEPVIDAMRMVAPRVLDGDAPPPPTGDATNCCD